MTKPRASTAVDCPICGTTIARRADLARHMRTHAINKEELMHTCPHIGCTYKTLQRSNLATHLNVHSRERPHKCPADGCDFSSSDPGSLTRHRKEIHGYEPKANSGNHPSAIIRKAARQRRRISPYTTSSSASSSSSGRSVSPLDTSSGMCHSPRPQVPQMLDLCPPSSLSPADNQNIKNILAAYSTELITKLPQVNHPTHTLNPEPTNSLPLTSESFTAPEAPTVEYPQLPMPEQADLHAVDLHAQSVSGTIPSDTTLDSFLVQFGHWAAPAHTATSLLTPVVEHTVDDAPAPGPASLPTPVIQYTVNNVPAPTPPPPPPYEYTVDNTPYGYPTAAVSFDALFSQPYSFAAPDMGYPEVINQTYFYTAPTATDVFPMPELYLC